MTDNIKIREEGNIYILNNDNYQQALEQFAQEKKLVMINCYAPWCGPCKALAPEYEKLANNLKDHPQIIIAKADCTTEENLCKQYEIKGYPTILIINNLEESERKISEYNRNRTAKDMQRYLESKIKISEIELKIELSEEEKQIIANNSQLIQSIKNNHAIHELNPQNWLEKLTENKKIIVMILYYYNNSIENKINKDLFLIFEELSNNFSNHEKVFLCQINQYESENIIFDNTNIAIINNLSCRTELIEKYTDNNNTTEEISNIIIDQLNKTNEEILIPEFTNENNIIELHNNNYYELLQQKKLFIILVYTSWCGHCKTFIPTYQELANKLTAHQEIILTQFNYAEEYSTNIYFPIIGPSNIDSCRKNTEIQAFPSIFILNNLQGQNELLKYDGARNEDEIINFLNQNFNTNISVNEEI